MKLDHSAAVAVTGLAVFQLVDMWNGQAPKLTDVRSAPAGDDSMRQALMDADFMVGGLALIVGVGVLYLTGDSFPLLMLGVTFAALSGWYHSVMWSESV